MDKRPIVYPYQEILFINTKKLLGIMRGCDYKESAQENFGGKRTALYSDCDDSYINLCMYENS